MNQIIEFSGNHPLLVGGFIALLIMLIINEVRQRALGIGNISPAEVIGLINGKNALLLDVREDKEYRAGHLIDSVHIPLSKLASRLSELKGGKDRPVVAYCRSGSRSMTACSTLKNNGFESVHNLAGGILAWQNAKLPVTIK